MPIRILIIAARTSIHESSQDLKQFLSEKEEFEIIGTATSGQEGIEIAKTNQLDVVLLNINITDMAALEVLPLIKVLQPNSRCIFISMASDPTILRQARILGADNFLSEPMLPDNIINTINHVLKNNKGIN